MILVSLALVVASVAMLAAGIFSDSDPLVWASLGAGLGAVALVAGSVVRRRRQLVAVPDAGPAAAGAVAVGSASPGPGPAPSPTPSRTARQAGPPSPPGISSWPWVTSPPGDEPAPGGSRHGWTGAVPAHPVPEDARVAPVPPAADPPPAGGAESVQDDAATLSGAALAGAGLPAADGAEPPVEDVPVRDALRVAQLADEVLVVDGHPRYHLAGCAALAGADLAPLPVSAARRAGFTPCATCAPDRTLLARSRTR